ncbi:FtsK/SpoIIIE domain-containing protein [Phaeacidiphilus oryzae]|uniref:FtsK/SpoIIIE domain-containing protein n=1 Tax=Phaeacidiphilus oryzae TaxID=348818 RepID=UPI00068FCEFF|nr:FtsK/SpoIIIE domain-containing protein [Phaeacidiphilus oryzae]
MTINGHTRPSPKLLPASGEDTVQDRVPETLPAVPAPIEGTVLPADSATPPARRPRVRIVHGAARTVRVVKVVATHQRTKAGGRMLVRHGLYVAAGAAVAYRHAKDARTTARHERMMRAAEAAGQHEVAMEWEQRAHAFREARHRRRMDMLSAPERLAKGAALTLGLTEGSLLLLGIVLAVAEKRVADVVAPTMFVIHAVQWIVFVAGLVWGPLLLAVPWLALLGLWQLGRARGTVPNWVLPADQQEKRDLIPDENAIVQALQHLGIAALNKAFKEGWQPRWIQPTMRMGNGYHAKLQLPMQVPVSEIVKKKAVLAHNLLRLPIEVWPTEPRKEPGVMDLWVADQGSTSGPVPPWPLLTEGTADYFKGIPVGVSQRGEPVIGKLMASNYMVGGIMGSGKSSLVIALLLGAQLDPLVEIEVYAMAYNVDYDPMKPRLRTLIKGDEDEQIEAAIHALRALRDEVTQRGKLLEELGGESTALTRELAERDPRMRPKVVVFDECHELFMHKKYGDEAEELAIKVMKKARKTGITLVWVTVSPTADSIPRDVTRNTSHRVAFAVGDHVANDGLLGSGKHKAGITATTLNPAEDVGTCLTVGFTKNPFELVRAYYVRKDAQADQRTPVVERALALRDGITPAPAPPAAERVDHLADIATAIGDEPRMRTGEMLQRLAQLNPGAYTGKDAQWLAQVLRDAGAPTYMSNGYPSVSRARVRAALEERDELAPADTPSDEIDDQ